MKKKIGLNEVIIILFVVLIIGIVSFSAKSYAKGDVNGDGKVNTTDYNLVKQYLAGKKTLTSAEKTRADVDKNGKIEEADSKAIQDIINKQTSTASPANTNNWYITYNGNGSTSGSVASHTCKTGSKCTIKANSFKKTGYVFVGWTTNKNGKDDGYVWTSWSGTWNYKNGQYGIDRNTLNLYAMWEKAAANKFVINYNGNGSTGGSVAIHTCTTDKECIINPSSFVKSGYVFVGWTTNSNGTDDKYGWTSWSGTWNYKNGQYGISNNTLNLYAMWEKADANKYVIIYHGNGADGGNVAMHTCIMNSPCTIKANEFTKSGYVFSSWTTNISGANDKYGWTGWSGTWKYKNGQYGINNNTLHLYASWNENPKFKIIYHKNGKTSSGTCTSTYMCRIEDWDENKSFIGWTTNSNGTDDKYGWTGWNGLWYFHSGEKGIVNNELHLYPIKSKSTVTPTPANNKYTGWKKENGNYYYYENGSMKKDAILYHAISPIDSKNGTTYLQADGKMCRNNLVSKNNQKYYCDSNGLFKLNSWVEYNGDWYYLSNIGEAYSNQEWKINGDYYRFASDGKMYKDYLYYDAQIKAYKYYGSDGKMYVEKWLKYNNSWYYFLKTGYSAIGNATYTINGKSYTFDVNGKCIKGDGC